MKNNLQLLIILIISFSSCTTLYKAGQTPDDVYYSPVRTYSETIVNDDRREEENNELENRQIRMGINNPRWRYYDNGFSYDPYSFGYNNNFWNGYNSIGFNNFNYNPYFMGYNNYCFNPYLPGHGFNNFYNPYFAYQPVYIIPVTPKNTTPRMTNLAAYGNNNYNNNNTYNSPKTGITKPTRNYNNRNNGSRVGNAIDKVLNSGNNSYNQNSNPSSNSNRVYSPSGNSNSNSSGTKSSSSGTGVSRPSRGK